VNNIIAKSLDGSAGVARGCAGGGGGGGGGGDDDDGGGGVVVVHSTIAARVTVVRTPRTDRSHDPVSSIIVM